MSAYRAFPPLLLAAGLRTTDVEYGVAQTAQLPEPENQQADDFWPTHVEGGRADAILCAVCHARE